MDFSIISPVIKEKLVPEFSEQWEEIAALLPEDLEISAKQNKALCRKRGIQRASDLLRLLLGYACCNWSLRFVGLWSSLIGFARMSDVALLNRFRKSSNWLGALIVQLLQRRGVRLQQMAGVQIQVVDATVITQPGSKGTDWRIHLAFDLGHLCLTQVQVTDGHGGESLRRFSAMGAVIQVADRIYSHVNSLIQPLQDGIAFVVRMQWNNLHLLDAQGKRFDIIPWLTQTFDSSSQPGECTVWLATPNGRFPLRLVGMPLPADQAVRARQRARTNSRKKKHQPDPRNVFAAGFIVLLSNLPEAVWSTSQILQLYRWRWQVELLIKRLKSLLNVDQLRAKDPDLARTYLLAQLLAALLVDELRTGLCKQIPDLLDPAQPPLSLWRLDAWLILAFRKLVTGSVPSLKKFVEQFPSLQRYLRFPKRKRPFQLAAVHSRLAALEATLC